MLHVAALELGVGLMDPPYLVNIHELVNQLTKINSGHVHTHRIRIKGLTSGAKCLQHGKNIYANDERLTSL